MRSPKSARGRTTRRSSIARTSSSSRGPGSSGRRRCRAGCRCSARAWMRPPLADLDRASSRRLFLIDAPTADVSSTAIRRAALAAANRSTGLVDPRVQHTLSSTDSIRRRRRDAARNRRHDRPCGRQVAWPRLKSDASRSSLPKQIDAAVRAARRQEGRRISSCSTCARRPGSPISSSSARAPIRGRCARSPTRVIEALRRRRRQAGARRRVRPVRVGPARLLRLHRARLRTARRGCSTGSSGSGAAPSASRYPQRRVTARRAAERSEA